jgi:hypothetical protein
MLLTLLQYRSSSATASVSVLDAVATIENVTVTGGAVVSVLLLESVSEISPVIVSVENPVNAEVLVQTLDAIASLETVSVSGGAMALVSGFESVSQLGDAIAFEVDITKNEIVALKSKITTSILLPSKITTTIVEKSKITSEILLLSKIR